MNRLWKYGLIILALGIMAFMFFWNHLSSKEKYQNQRDARTTPFARNAQGFRESEELHANRMKEKIMKALDSPIDFWGKVLDEKGNPVAGAEIVISVEDKLSSPPNHENSRTDYHEISDASGLFSLRGKRGAGLRVKVAAVGYTAAYNEKTRQDMSVVELIYYGKNDNMHHARPTEGAPTVFVLRKKNAPAKSGP